MKNNFMFATYVLILSSVEIFFSEKNLSILKEKKKKYIEKYYYINKKLFIQLL